MIGVVMIRASAISALGVLFANVASAADNGIYLGAGIATSDIDFDTSSGAAAFRLKGDDTSFKIIAGVRPVDWLAFEANYVDFGSVSTAAGDLDLKGFDAFAVGLFEIAIVDLYAKAGVVRWDRKVSNSGSISGSDNGYDPAYGAGVQVHLGSLGVRGEYERFNIEDTDTGMVSLAVTWTFL